MSFRYYSIFSLVALVLLTGCPQKPTNTGTQQTGLASPTSSVTFADVTKQAGIDFTHVNGKFGKKWLPETMGSGCAWIDYNNDGYQDLYLINSRPWTETEKRGADKVELNLTSGPIGKFYQNNGDGTFTDVTAKVKLNVVMYGMGACVGDYDNDGYPDLYVTAVGRNYLYRNTGKGSFEDVTDKTGTRDKGWSSSAAWVDYDKDGHLDLAVCHYVIWTPKNDIPNMQNGHLIYAPPTAYTGEAMSLFHNNGKGKFTEVAKKSGLHLRGDGVRAQGKSLGIVVCDYDNDGYSDLVVANDNEPNYLFQNQKNGTFKEIGVELGIALSDEGRARGAMGIDACDYDRKGRESVLIGNFANQMLAMYHNEGMIFRDDAAMNGLGPASKLSLSFGLFFFDMDNDGWQDIFVANGHIEDSVEETQKEVKFAQHPLIFRNLGGGKFDNLETRAGDLGSGKFVARGCAYADMELRGVQDIALTTNNGPAYLFRNTGSQNRSLRLELEGTKSNRSGIGSKIKVQVGTATQLYVVRSGSSYLSQSELPITVGLGTAETADSISIEWTSGETTKLEKVKAGEIYKVVEGKGIVSQKPLNKKP